MEDWCVICKCDVSRGTAKAKRLKLYGDSATSVRMSISS